MLLRINRAATCVRWSPKENKFAVGCGAKLINICYFEEANNWWISKHIKKPIKSTVTSIDWHPNNILIGCGSTDYKAKIFSTFLKEVDSNDGNHQTPWGGKPIFGNLIGEFATGGGNVSTNRIDSFLYDSTLYNFDFNLLLYLIVQVAGYIMCRFRQMVIV